MYAFAERRARRLFVWALLASVALHGLVLFVLRTAPRATSSAQAPGSRLAARLAPPPPKALAPPPLASPAPAAPAQVQTPPRRRVLRAENSPAAPVPAPPQFSAAEKAEMQAFLDSLQAEQAAQPSLAQRALREARNIGRELERKPSDASAAREASADQRGPISIERIPDSPPLDPFTLDMYLDALVSKLNRSSAFVRRDARAAGVQRGLAQLRLNPDGSIRSFEVLRAGDQQNELEYLARLVNRAAPYAPFPPDIVQSARSMSILICILPPTENGGVGFSRKADGKGC